MHTVVSAATLLIAVAWPTAASLIAIFMSLSEPVPQLCYCMHNHSRKNVYAYIILPKENVHYSRP